MREKGPSLGLLQQALYCTPHDVASTPRSLVQGGKQPPPTTKTPSSELDVRLSKLLWSRALLGMGDHRLPKGVMSGELENARQGGPGGKEKQ